MLYFQFKYRKTQVNHHEALTQAKTSFKKATKYEKMYKGY